MSNWEQKKEAVPFLADTVSETVLPRVCCIFDALIKAIEPLGCSLTDDLKFIVNGETVSLSVSESQDRLLCKFPRAAAGENCVDRIHVFIPPYCGIDILPR